ncbi:hypothetical protein RQP46_003524 [Phenoliferia psychrophenolica]
MTIVAGLGSLMFGFDTGVVSGALVVIGADLGGETLSVGQEEWIAAAMVFKELVLGRVIVGLGVGLASAVIPLYLAELSPAKYRGRIVASLVVLITGGQVLAYVVDAIFFSWKGGWRYMIGLGAVPAIVQLILSCTISESPRYLILHNRLAPARKTLKLIYSLESDAEIHIRVERIQAELAREQEENFALDGLGVAKAKAGLFKKLWRDRGTRKALLLASGKILQAAHFAKPANFAILIAVSNFICTIVALRLIDHSGRRTLLLRTIPGMAIGMFFTGLSFIFIPSGPVEGSGAGAWAYLGLFAMVCFCCSYALGLGNVPWVVQGDVFYRYELRAVGTGLSTVLTPTGAFWLYGLVAVLAWVFTYCFLPGKLPPNLLMKIDFH